MGEAGQFQVVCESWGYVPVSDRPVAPGPQVDLGDRDRCLTVVSRTPGRHPFVVAPVVVERRDHRGCERWHLGRPGHRIRLQQLGTVLRPEEELVPVPAGRSGHPAGPAPIVRPFQHGGPGFPVVEVADDRHRRCGRRPHAERAAIAVQVCAQQSGHVGVDALIGGPASGLRRPPGGGDLRTLSASGHHMGQSEVHVRSRRPSEGPEHRPCRR